MILCIDRRHHADNVDYRQAAFVHRFAQGSGGHCVSWEEARRSPVSTPWVIRGMKYTPAVREAMQQGREFWYIDNGYFGNEKFKTWFRIIHNGTHDTREIIPRPRDRLDRANVRTRAFAPGSFVLLAPPSPKSFTLYGIDQDQWIQETVTEIKKHTDRPIVIRLKKPRNERVGADNMESALQGAHCLVTYNSVSAVEALILGKPAIALGPNAAGRLSSQDLSEIENPRVPTEDEREAWLRHLSYSQFTFEEMRLGQAWRILHGS